MSVHVLYIQNHVRSNCIAHKLDVMPTVLKKCVLERDGGFVKWLEATASREYPSLHSCGFSTVLGGQQTQALVFRTFGI